MIEALYQCGPGATGTLFVKNILNDHRLREYMKKSIKLGPVATNYFDPNTMNLKDWNRAMCRCNYLPELLEATKGQDNWRGFCHLRDPRDMVFTEYFSYRFSHGMFHNLAVNMRQYLNSISFNDGIKLMLIYLTRTFENLRQWHEYDDPRLIKLTCEELFDSPFNWFTKLFKHLEIEVPDHVLLEVIDTEDKKRDPKPFQYMRLRSSSTHGNYRNFTNDDLAGEMKFRMGNLVSLLGYEKDENWKGWISNAENAEINQLFNTQTILGLASQANTPEKLGNMYKGKTAAIYGAGKMLAKNLAYFDNINLIAVADDYSAGDEKFGHKIVTLNDALDKKPDIIFITPEVYNVKVNMLINVEKELAARKDWHCKAICFADWLFRQHTKKEIAEIMFPLGHYFRDNIVNDVDQTVSSQIYELEFEQRRAEFKLLRQYLKMRWKSWVVDGIHHVALMGAGKHTKWLLTILDLENASPKPVCIIDDAPEVDEIAGIPVIRPDRISDYNFDGIVASSDIHQDKLEHRCKEIVPKDIPVLLLYEDIPKHPHPK